MIDIENISFDHCIKCTVCTIYCPVARVTHLYPGPKWSGPDTERLRIKNPELLDASLKYFESAARSLFLPVSLAAALFFSSGVEAWHWKQSVRTAA